MSAAADEARRFRNASIAAAIGAITAVGIGLSLSIPLLSIEMERMGVSGAGIGLNTGVAGLAAVMVVPFAPRIAQAVGVLRLMWAAVLTAAACLIGFFVVRDFYAWFPLRFVFSAAIGVLFVMSEFWINAAAPPARRGFVLGIYSTVLATGFAIGPAVLALVGTSGPAPYLAGTALILAAALPLTLARGLSPTIGQGTGRSLAVFIAAAPVATFAALVFGAVESGGFALLPVYGLAIGYGPESAAFLVSLVALGNGAFQIPLGAYSDRVDRRVLLLVVAFLGLLGAAAMPFAAHSALWFGVLLFVWGGVVGSLYTVGLAHLGARFSGADLASANAAFVILYNIGAIVGPPALGGGMDLLPPHGFPATLATFFALYLAVVTARLAAGRARGT